MSIIFNSEQKAIVAFYTSEGVPATGLVVSLAMIKCSDLSEITPVDSRMYSIAGGGYQLSAARMPSVTDDDVFIRVEGPDTLGDADRWKAGILTFGGEVEDRLDDIDTAIADVQTAVDNLPAPSDATLAAQVSIAGAIDGLPTPSDATLAAQVSIAAAVATVNAGLPTGSGSVDGIDHDYGGTDNLRVVDGEGAAVDNAELHIFLKTDYDNDLRTSAYRKAQTYTDINGRWRDQAHLDPAVYRFVAIRPGHTETTETEFTVTAP